MKPKRVALDTSKKSLLDAFAVTRKKPSWVTGHHRERRLQALPSLGQLCIGAGDSLSTPDSQADIVGSMWWMKIAS